MMIKHLKNYYFISLAGLISLACTPQLEVKPETQGNKSAIESIQDTEQPVKVGIIEGDAHGTEVSLPAGVLSIGSQLEVNEIESVPLEFQGSNITKASPVIEVSAKDQNGQNLESLATPMTIAIPYQSSLGLLLSSRIDKLCAMLKSPKGLFVWYRNDFASIDESSKKVKIKSNKTGVFRLSYCETDVLPEFTSAVDAGLTGEEVKEVAPEEVQSVINDDVLTSDSNLYVQDGTVTEANTTLNVMLVLEVASDKEINVEWSTADGTAFAGTHYGISSGVAKIPIGQTSVTLPVPIYDNSSVTGDLYFHVDINNPINAKVAQPRARIVIVENDQPPVVSVSDVSIPESASTVEVTVSLDKVSDQTLTVDYETIDQSAFAGNQYELTTGTLTFAAEETSKIVSIPLTANNVISNSVKTFQLKLSNPINATIANDTAVVSLIDDEESKLTITDVSVPENGGNVTATISMDVAHEEDVTVVWGTLDDTATNQNHYLSKSEQAIIVAGQTSVQISIAIIDNGLVDDDRSFFVKLLTSTGATILNDLAVVHIQNDEVNTAPTMEVNTGASISVYEVLNLTNSMLLAYDVDVDQKLTYTIESIPDNGRLMVNGTEKSIGDTFLQTDIGSGLVKMSLSSVASSNFMFSVSDGMASTSSVYFNVISTATCSNGGSASQYNQIGFGDDPSWPYVICNVTQWESLSASVAGWGNHYRLGASIDMSNISNYTPVGNATAPFFGTFDGGWFSISNLTVYSSNNHVGLFGFINGANITNISLYNIDITGGNHVGLIAGKMQGGLISNAWVTGNVSGGSYVGLAVGTKVSGDSGNLFLKGTVFGHQKVGGFAGAVIASSEVNIHDVHVIGKVSMSSEINDTSVGGFVGYLSGPADISDSGTSSLVEANFGVHSNGSAGGFVGTCDGATGINRSYAIGKLRAKSASGTGHVAGGFAGSCFGTTISMSQSKGSVDVEGVFSAGGFIGLGSATLDRNYTTADVRGKQSTYLGGFMGQLSEDSSSVLTNNISFGKIRGDGVLAGFIADDNQSSGGSFSASKNIWNKNLNANMNSLGFGSSNDVMSKFRYQLKDMDTFSLNGYVFDANNWFMSTYYEAPIHSWETDGFSFDQYVFQDKPVGASKQESFTISGQCPVNGDTLVVYYGSDEDQITCLGNTWSHPLSYLDIVSEGDFLVSVALYTPGNISVNGLKKVIARNIIIDKSCNSDINGASLGASGTGTVADPYVLCNPSDIQDLWALGATGPTSSSFVLGDDIDLSSVTGAAPIAFSGELFDGRGYEISNLSLFFSANAKVGFFGDVTNVNSVIKNIGFVNPYVVGSQQVGTVVGNFQGSKLENIWVRSGSTSPSIYGASEVGGIVGSVSSTTARSVLSDLRVDGLSMDVSGSNGGGIVGKSVNTDISNTHATGVLMNITGLFGGGLVGLLDQSSVRASQAEMGSITSSGAKVGGLIGATAYEVSVAESFADMSLNSIVNNVVKIGGLIGEVSTAGVGIAQIVRNHAKGEINAEGSHLGGLIGQVTLGTNGISTIEKNYTHVTYNLTGVSQYVGGLLGYGHGNINYNVSEGDINNAQSIVGGLIGFYAGGQMLGSKSFVNVQGSYNIGGLIGEADVGTVVSSSEAHGGVTATGSFVSRAGGLVGSLGGSIINSYATGNVIATGSEFSDLGGLVGYIYSPDASISFSYSVGGVSGAVSNMGGFVGNNSIGALMSNNFWDTTTSIASSFEEVAGAVEGKSTTEMKSQSTYNSWDFMNIWRIDQGASYPTLK